jgi:hypothetical protein
VVELLGHPVIGASTTRVVAHFALRRVVGHLAGRRLVQESINVVHQGVEAWPEVEMRVVVNEAQTDLVLNFFELVLTDVLQQLTLLQREV